MMKRHLARIGIASGIIVFWATPAVYGLSSPNFVIQEDFIGTSGSLPQSSSNYSARDSIGSSTVGEASSDSYTTDSGAITPDEPRLSFIVNTADVDLGALSPGITKIGTASFSVLNYTSFGYIVQTIGDPPDNGAHTLEGMSTASASAVGVEQFGMNLVANTQPEVFGADPVQQPDDNFGFGMASSGYDTADMFKYVPGEVIANAPRSSGRTDYTISYIANVSNNTPGGSYSGKQTLVVTGTY